MSCSREAVIGLLIRASRYAEEGVSSRAFGSARALEHEIAQRERDAKALAALAEAYVKSGKPKAGSESGETAREGKEAT